MPKDKTDQKKDDTFKIPLRIVPNETENIEAEMQDIFDEDKIVHRHGSAEPEHD